MFTRHFNNKDKDNNNSNKLSNFNKNIFCCNGNSN